MSAAQAQLQPRKLTAEYIYALLKALTPNVKVQGGKIIAEREGVKLVVYGKKAVLYLPKHEIINILQPKLVADKYEMVVKEPVKIIYNDVARALKVFAVLSQ